MYDDLIRKLNAKLTEAIKERNHWKDANDFYFEYWEGEVVAFSEALGLVRDAQLDAGEV